MEYIVAGIRISLPTGIASGHFAKALEPFAAVADGTPDLVLQPETPVQTGGNYRLIDTFDFPDVDAECHFGSDDAGYLFEMIPRNGSGAIRLRKTPGNPIVVSNITPQHDPAMLRFGLWMAFNLTAVPLGTVAVHSSVLTYRGGAVMVLGESGTGKSTHTRLWRQHIAGAGLLNDDSPMVRIEDGTPTVYGSPWSGKTPCYKNECLPLKAIMRLSQAPHNRIEKLSPIRAYAAIQPSFPPALVRDEPLFDAINDLASKLLGTTPAYHLECLPDQAAARLACETIFNER